MLLLLLVFVGLIPYKHQNIELTSQAPSQNLFPENLACPGFPIKGMELSGGCVLRSVFFLVAIGSPSHAVSVRGMT